MVKGKLRREETVKSEKSKKRRLKVFAVGFIVGAAVLAAGLLLLDAAVSSMSRPEFCVKCHEMESVYASWKLSPHHTNSSGMTVACADCHLPPREDYTAYVSARLWTGAKDICLHLFSNYDAEAVRRTVLEALPNMRCLHCHDNLNGQPSLGSVRIVHAASLENPGDRRHACVACHDTLHGPKAEPGEAKEYEAGDNSYCYVCHVNFDGEEFVAKHLEAGVSCDSCHGESLDHAADEDHVTPADILFPKSKVDASCMTAECHPREAMEKEIGHRPLFAGADAKNQYCTDCHGEHRLDIDTRQRRWDKETRKLIEKDGHPVDPGDVIRSEFIGM